MRTTISKQFRWEMGHRLPLHDGLCKNVHGHSYEAHVILSGEPDASGMVMDYFDLKTIVQPLIDELDHCFLLDDADEVMHAFFAQHPMKIVRVPFPTTAENIARMLAERVAQNLPASASIDEVKVRVYETEKTYAETALMI
jgi:6-pyruvoyltetrahydropterin/6-carboxytetrahydropterin synthase